MTDDRDGIESRALLGNSYLRKVLDEMEANATARVAASAVSDIDTLRVEAIRLKVVRDFKSTLTLTSKKV